MEMDELVAASDVAVDANCRLESTETSSSSSDSSSSSSSAGTTTANNEATAAAVDATTNASSPSSSSSSPSPVILICPKRTSLERRLYGEDETESPVPLESDKEERRRIRDRVKKQHLKDDDEEIISNVTCDQPTNTNLMTSANVTSTPTFQTGAVESLDELGTAERLDKYSMSDIVFHRQIAARTLLDTLHEVELYGKNLQLVTTVINRFANDPEPSIRAELAEQLPQIACFCLSPQNGVPPAMSNITLPILVQFLTDINSQVRKITQNSLAYMMEQNIVDLQFVEYKICPVLVHLMDITNMDDYRIEAVTTVSKIVRFLGKNVTEKVFLCHFSRLCSDVSFHVRRACAANFGEICSVVGKQLTESTLLCPFRSLCEDDIWGVRKACADVFVPVSCVCSDAVRKYVLAPLFVSLLCDQSKWVKTAAFQALGPFISTFADPSKTGIYYTEGGLVVVEDAKEHESNSSGSTDSGCSVDSSNSNDDCDTETAGGNANSRSLPSFVNKLSLGELSTCYSGLTNSPENMDTSPSLECPNSVNDSSTLGDSTTGGVTIESFNCFNYWRIPLGEFSVDPELSDCIHGDTSFLSKDSTNNNLLDNLDPSNDINSEMKDDDHDDENDDDDEVEVDKDTEHQLNSNHDDKNDNLMKEGEIKSDINDLIDKFLSTMPADYLFAPKETSETSRDINMGCMMDFNYQNVKKLLVKQETVPLDLLEHYLKMINPPSNFENVDHDLSHHCAYSFPAVAMTLGRKHWPCLKEAYEYLARDLHMKVRWTLASSLHQMALILGPEHTSRDLLPIFMSFTRDSEEVRFAILQNLSSILPLFNRIEQLAILPRIGDFLYSDKPRNWRFRYTLAEQVMGISSLYCPSDIKECLLPIAYTLLQDKVSEVRLAAIRLMSNLLKHFFCDVSSSVPRLDNGPMETGSTAYELVSDWLSGIVDWRSKWIYRQSFVFLCEQMVVDDSIPSHVFNEYFLEYLLSLANDRVPNVRLALSRCLARSFFGNVMYNEQQEAVTSILTKFKSDTDLDVRRFSQSVLASDDEPSSSSSQPDTESTVSVD